MEIKKGIQLNQAFGAVLAVVLVAVLVIIAVFLFDVLAGDFSTTTFTVVNETGVTIDFPGVSLTPSACFATNFVISLALNNSNGTDVIVAANYSVSNTGLLINETLLAYDNATITYTYIGGEGACNASQDLITQFATYPALVGLVGTIVFLGLVIGVLVASFVFSGKRGV